MSVRTSFIGIGVAGTLVIGLVAGLVRAHESAPPSLGDTIEVTTSPAAGGGETPAAPGGPEAPGATAASPGPASPPAPARTSTPATAGGRAVPPPVAQDDDDDDGADDDDDD